MEHSGVGLEDSQFAWLVLGLWQLNCSTPFRLVPLDCGSYVNDKLAGLLLRVIVYLIERGDCMDSFDLPFLACLSLVDILCTGFAVIENTALAWAALQK